METAQLKQELQDYINNGDERLLKMLHALAREYNNEGDGEYELTAEELSVLEEESEAYWKGESKAYDWETVKEMITGKK